MSRCNNVNDLENFWSHLQNGLYFEYFKLLYFLLNCRSSKATDLSGLTSSETKVIEGLRDIEMKGNKTVNLNTSNEHCSQLCESPKLAQNICQYGSSCKVKSSDCFQESVCNCSLTLTCLEVSDEFRNLMEMKAEKIKENAAKNLQVTFSRGMI